MNRQEALVLIIIIFIFFVLLTYYGAQIKLYSSIVFSVFVSLILLNLFYPVSQAAQDNADFTLVLYILIQIIGVLILAVYIGQKTLTDTRNLDYYSTIG